MHLEVSCKEMLPLRLMDFEVFFFFLNLYTSLGSALPHWLEKQNIFISFQAANENFIGYTMPFI